MEWVIFGDDWGRHPSTVQHLVRHFPGGDRVVWVNSLGMRSPSLGAGDLRRALGRLRRVTTPPAPLFRESAHAEVHPIVLPWHLEWPAVLLNRWALRHQIAHAWGRKRLTRPFVLSVTPIAVPYLRFPRSGLAYLRLDDYGALPGVDPEMIAAYERRMFDEADLIFATAKNLLPSRGRLLGKCRYIPQGVEHEHFARVPLEPPRTKILGFFGLVAEWLDFELVAAVAEACPDWSLEFIGPIRYAPTRVRSLRNVHLLDARPYADLPGAIARWGAAWIPFAVSRLTEGVNPLKLREYLAAGLPTLSTPMPEVVDAELEVDIVSSAADVRARLAHIFASDTAEARARRRSGVRGHSWDARAQMLRAAFQDLRPT